MPRKKKDGIKISYLINRVLVEKLDAYCDETGLPKTYVIEQALDMYLKSVYENAKPVTEKSNI